MGYTVHNFQPNEVLHASELNEMDAQILNNLVNTATIQTTNVAVKNYVVGEYLTYDGILYEVTAAIASGGTITPGTNCTQTNVGAELTAANAEIDSLRESLSTLSNYEILYTGTAVSLLRYGKVYHLRFNGASTANYSAAIPNIESYFPSSLFAPMYTISGGVNYLAYFSVASGTTSAMVTGTYGSAPTNFVNTVHTLYGSVCWVK